MDRTDTTHQYIFQAPGPGLATFDFSNTNHIHIVVPSDSTWYCQTHWHSHEPACVRIDCIQSDLLVGYEVKPLSSGDDYISPGSYDKFRMNARYRWKRLDNEPPSDDDSLEVVLTVTDETLYRNKCSAALDADRYPDLATTPIYLKFIFAALWSTARARLIAKLLWVQLQAMNYAHGYYEFHGVIPLTYLWRLTHPFNTDLPPMKLAQIEWQSVDIISRLTQSACFWIGKLALGIKGQYPQYTPATDLPIDAKEKS